VAAGGVRGAWSPATKIMKRDLDASMAMSLAGVREACGKICGVFRERYSAAGSRRTFDRSNLLSSPMAHAGCLF
jgi:hypothetical protein